MQIQQVRGMYLPRMDAIGSDVEGRDRRHGQVPSGKARLRRLAVIQYGYVPDTNPERRLLQDEDKTHDEWSKATRTAGGAVMSTFLPVMLAACCCLLRCLLSCYEEVSGGILLNS